MRRVGMLGLDSRPVQAGDTSSGSGPPASWEAEPRLGKSTPKMGASESQSAFVGRFPVLALLAVGSGPPLTLKKRPPSMRTLGLPNTSKGTFLKS